MKEIEIKSVRMDSTSPISIGDGILSTIPDLVKNYSKIGLLLDSNVERLWGGKLRSAFPAASVLIIPAGEESKSIARAEKIWQAMKDFGFDRRSVLLNVGGGMIGDLGGFAASTYMRGIDFIQIPTTLLAQVDASVGGKTAVNLGSVKNLIGTFQQPRRVVIDVRFLTTLPEREYRAGFAEIIKHALILDREYLKLFEDIPGPSESARLLQIVERSCRIKASIVESDPLEKGPRKLLNFGHTIGHALESVSLKGSSPLLHGEAVCLGIVAESFISNRLLALPSAELKAIGDLIVRFGLPVKTSFDIDSALKILASDKKSEHGEVKWTLLKSIGEGSFNHTVPAELVRESLSYIRA